MYDSIRSVVEPYFQQNFNDVPVDYANTDFSMPKDSAWIRISITPNVFFTNNEGYISFSPPTIQYDGVVNFQFFIPLNTGTGLLGRLSNKIRDLFINKTIETIEFGVPSLQIVGKLEGWFRANLIVSYYQNQIIEVG